MMTVMFAVKLGWFPVGGMRTIGVDESAFGAVLDVMHHLVLPATALGLFYAATFARVMRASMLEVARLDFVRTARAKGLSGGRVVLAHVLRNAMLPIVTLLGLQLGTMLGGSVVIEAVFSWPGIGSLLFDSVMSRNFPMVLGVLTPRSAAGRGLQRDRRSALSAARSPDQGEVDHDRVASSISPRRFARNRAALVGSVSASWSSSASPLPRHGGFPSNPLRIVGRPEIWPLHVAALSAWHGSLRVATLRR